MKRILALAVLIMVGLFMASLLPPSYSPASLLSTDATNLPPLRSLKYLPYGGLNLDLKGGQIEIGLVYTEGSDPDVITADLIAVFNWTQSYFRPYKCGEEYEPNLCRFMDVTIHVVGLEESLSPSGPGKSYVYFLDLKLDQVQIVEMLKAPPADIDSLAIYIQLHGTVQTYDPPALFTGFK